MKKDIEWAKEKIKEIHTLTFDSYEAAVIANNKHFQMKNSEQLALINKIMEILDQLDEPEILSQEWVAEHEMPISWMAKEQKVVRAEDLQTLLVPKQEDMFNGEKPDEGEVYFAIGLGGAVEVNVARSIGEAIEILTEHDTNYSVSRKPVIPKFVAEWYESEGKRNSWWNWFYKWGRDECRTELETKTIRWMQDFNEEKFVGMFLHGYTVEEEQKYVVELPNPNNQMGRHKNVFLNKKDGKVFIDSADLFVNDITKYGQFALTEEEIKKDFEWAWEFAKPVEELEE